MQWLTRSPDTREIPSSSLGIVIFLSTNMILLDSLIQEISLLVGSDSLLVGAATHHQHNEENLHVISLTQEYDNLQSNQSEANMHGKEVTILLLSASRTEAMRVHRIIVAAATRVSGSSDVRVLCRSQLHEDVRLLHLRVVDRVPVVSVVAIQTVRGIHAELLVGRQLLRATVGEEPHPYFLVSRVHLPSSLTRR